MRSFISNNVSYIKCDHWCPTMWSLISNNAFLKCDHLYPTQYNCSTRWNEEFLFAFWKAFQLKTSRLHFQRRVTKWSKSRVFLKSPTTSWYFEKIPIRKHCPVVCKNPQSRFFLSPKAFSSFTLFSRSVFVSRIIQTTRLLMCLKSLQLRNNVLIK